MESKWVEPSVLYRWAINGAALLIVSFLSSGVRVSGLLSLLLAAVVLGLVNAYIRPAVLFLTLPLNVVMLGLFTFVVNGLMLIVTSALVPGFAVTGFWSALWAALLLSVVSSLLSSVVGRR